jgi:hypothetical protein
MWNSSLLPYCTPLDFDISWFGRLIIYCRHCTMFSNIWEYGRCCKLYIYQYLQTAEFQS